jgi:putative spermidine/putrescine transport system substrate-binding protein
MAPHRTSLSFAIIFAAPFVLIPLAPAASAEPLTVVSWGGAYTNSQVEAYMKPYTEKTGVRFNVVDYNGGLDQVARQVESGEIVWDVVDVELSDAVRGCDAGLFEEIPHKILPAGTDGASIYDDFLPHALQDCAVGEVVWATVYAYDQTKFPGAKPLTIAHFFDIERFPGKRGLRKSPRVNIEWALMADGVAPDKVYEELAKPGGVVRAFKVLDRIKDHIVWWEAGSQPPRMLDAGEVVMTSAYNGRLYDPIVKEDRPYVIVWDGQVWDFDLWAIVKGSRNLKTALDFVAFSTSTQRLADQAKYISYGPARHSSMALIGPEMKWQLPTSTENSQTAVQNDFDWWSDNQERMDRRFEEWLAGK